MKMDEKVAIAEKAFVPEKRKLRQAQSTFFFRDLRAAAGLPYPFWTDSCAFFTDNPSRRKKYIPNAVIGK